VLVAVASVNLVPSLIVPVLGQTQYELDTGVATEADKQPAVSQRDARRSWDRNGAGDPGHHVGNKPCLVTGLDLFESTAEHEGIASLETDHSSPRPGMLDQQAVDLGLRSRSAVRHL
jgi:hypothetical protein